MGKNQSLIEAPVEAYLKAARIPLRLACTTEAGWPFVLSLWYVYDHGALYCATQETARIVSYLRQNPKCAFEVASDLPPYCGARGRAQATIEPDQGYTILNLLLERYLSSTDNPLAEELLKRSDREVAIRLEPLSIYTWNFTSRMQGSVPGQPEKPCPP